MVPIKSAVGGGLFSCFSGKVYIEPEIIKEITDNTYSMLVLRHSVFFSLVPLLLCKNEGYLVYSRPIFEFIDKKEEISGFDIPGKLGKCNFEIESIKVDKKNLKNLKKGERLVTVSIKQKNEENEENEGTAIEMKYSVMLDYNVRDSGFGFSRTIMFDVKLLNIQNTLFNFKFSFLLANADTIEDILTKLNNNGIPNDENRKEAVTTKNFYLQYWPNLVNQNRTFIHKISLEQLEYHKDSFIRSGDQYQCKELSAAHEFKDSIK